MFTDFFGKPLIKGIVSRAKYDQLAAQLAALQSENIALRQQIEMFAVTAPKPVEEKPTRKRDGKGRYIKIT